MGKYDSVVDKYPELELEDEEDPRAQEKVNAYKAVIQEKEVHNPESLASAYRLLREGIGNPIEDEFKETLFELLGVDGLKALLKEIGIRKAAYEQLLSSSHKGDEPGWGMYGAGENSVKLADGGSVSVQREPTGKVIDKEAFRKWCIQDGLESQLQLWPSTMQSIVKKRCLDGDPEPDGIEIFTRTKVVLRKG